MNYIKIMRENPSATIKTMMLTVSFFTLGMSGAIIGPTLLDLQLQTSTTIDKISLVLTARSVGIGLGALIGKHQRIFFCSRRHDI